MTCAELWADYEAKKAAWEANPNPTTEAEKDAAMAAIQAAGCMNWNGGGGTPLPTPPGGGLS